MVRYLAVLFGAGATLSHLSLLLPHDPAVDVVAVRASATAAYPTVILLVLFGPRIPRWAIHLILASGTAIITVGIHFGGGGVASAVSGVFYVWVALFAATFFSAAATAAHVALIAVAYGGQLVYAGGRSDMAAWVMIVGTVAITAYVVGRLAEQNTLLAGTDPLTGLPNRRTFDSVIGYELEHLRPGSELMVAILDLDNFKHVNDTLGHAAGDELLIVCARRLSACVRENDVVARLGGDEFAVVFDPQSTVPPDAIARRILDTLGEPVELDGHAIVISASIGFARSTADRGRDELLRNADLAMYVAKSARSGGFEVYDDSMHQRALERLQLEMELREAIANRSISVAFQPIVDITTGRVKAVEVLARWSHPVLGQVGPQRFIPVAERTGLIRELGLQVFEQACRTAAVLHRTRPEIDVTVNVSPVQLEDDDLAPRLAALLREHRLDPARFVIEITESALMQDASAAAERLTALKRIGVRVAVDDFGVGHSSLSYLRNFPVDVLKIDKSFVDGLPTGGGQLARAVIQLGQMLGLEVVAEGVELQSQLDELRVLGCGRGQGYLFASPMSADDLFAHLRDARDTAEPTGTGAEYRR